MQENTNKAIALNTLILYVRLTIVSVCGLFYTRFSLQALGDIDYGLFYVIGGTISLIAIINSIMIATSNRFMAIAIGHQNIDEACRVFNTNLAIHIGIAIISFIIACPLGYWYISHFLHYTGDISNAYWVFYISVSAAIFSFISVPYNGLLLAKERFFVFCSTDVISVLIKLLFTYWLISYTGNRIVLYTIVAAITTVYPTLVFMHYCRRAFPEIVRYRLTHERSQYIEVVRFASNMSIGAVAYIAKFQGTAVIVNLFFNTVINTAVAVANSVNSIVSLFANNIQKSIAPQIVKSYARNEVERYTYLVCFSSKVTYLAMLCIALPFFLIPETLFGLWLDHIPAQTIVITQLLIIDTLIVSLNAGIPDLVFATGRVRTYQLCVNGLSCLAVVAGFLALYLHFPVLTLFYCYIGFSIVIFFVRPYLLHRVVAFSVRTLTYQVYFPSITLTCSLFPLYLLRGHLSPWLLLIVCYTLFAILLLLFGLSNSERQVLKKALLRLIKRA